MITSMDIEEISSKIRELSLKNQDIDLVGQFLDVYYHLEIIARTLRIKERKHH